MKDKWLSSPRGTAVFTGGEDFVKSLAGATTLYFRAYDYRGAGTLLTIPLGGSQAPLEEVLAACVKPPPDPALAGVEEQILDQVNRWGPRFTVANKGILARLHFYSDAMDASKPASFFVAVESLHQKIREECGAGKRAHSMTCPPANNPEVAGNLGRDLLQRDVGGTEGCR